MTETRIPDPWSAKKLPDMVERLKRVGATDTEVAEFTEQWLYDPEWDTDSKHGLYAMSDPRLRRDLEETRRLNLIDRETEDETVEREQSEVDEAAELERIGQLADEAARVAMGTSADVLAWVGDDPERRQVALEHEIGCAKPRKGVIEKLSATG